MNNAEIKLETWDKFRADFAKRYKRVKNKFVHTLPLTPLHEIPKVETK